MKGELRREKLSNCEENEPNKTEKATEIEWLVWNRMFPKLDCKKFVYEGGNKLRLVGLLFSLKCQDSSEAKKVLPPSGTKWQVLIGLGNQNTWVNIQSKRRLRSQSLLPRRFSSLKVIRNFISSTEF